MSNGFNYQDSWLEIAWLNKGFSPNIKTHAIELNAKKDEKQSDDVVQKKQPPLK